MEQGGFRHEAEDCQDGQHGGLGQGREEQSVGPLPRNSQDGGFYRAMLSVHRQGWEQAYTLIDLTRDMLDTELTALLAESYQRALLNQHWPPLSGT